MVLLTRTRIQVNSFDLYLPQFTPWIRYFYRDSVTPLDNTYFYPKISIIHLNFKFFFSKNLPTLKLTLSPKGILEIGSKF